MTKERIYSMIHGDEDGEFIQCTDCETKSLVYPGVDVCPNCLSRGCNTWVNDDQYEYTADEIEAMDNVEIVYLPDERCKLVEKIDLAL